MPRRLKRYHGRGDLHFIAFAASEGRALSDRNRNLRSRLACGEQAPLKASLRKLPSKTQGKQDKQGKQKFFPSWFHRGRGWGGAEKKQRDSSLRDPAHKNRAEEKAGSLRSE
jgi:hypothetical protein